MKCIILSLSNLIIAVTTQIGETIADKVTGKALPSIKVEEPTVKMAFSINTSPFVGREVCI
jgi:predicted membrane GTPase involved in stress response